MGTGLRNTTDWFNFLYGNNVPKDGYVASTSTNYDEKKDKSIKKVSRFTKKNDLQI